jgi:Fe2+ transport system protein FeoA
MDAGYSGVVHNIQRGYGIMSTMKSLGVIPGKRIARITPERNGPITIEMDKVHVMVGFGMASRIVIDFDT